MLMPEGAHGGPCGPSVLDGAEGESNSALMADDFQGSDVSDRQVNGEATYERLFGPRDAGAPDNKLTPTHRTDRELLRGS